MATSLNRAQLIGRVGRDPEISKTPSGQTLAKFTLATSEDYNSKDGSKKENTQWHNITVWGRLAEAVVEKYVRKGRLLLVEGKIQYSQYPDSKTGDIKYWTSIKCENLVLLDHASDTRNSISATTNSDSEPSNYPDVPPPEDYDDDIPF